jgi:hypothetical protein
LFEFISRLPGKGEKSFDFLRGCLVVFFIRPLCATHVDTGNYPQSKGVVKVGTIKFGSYLKFYVRGSRDFDKETAVPPTILGAQSISV